MRDWNRLPRAAVGAPSLEVLKDYLDRACEQPGLVKVFLLVAGGLEVDDL